MNYEPRETRTNNKINPESFKQQLPDNSKTTFRMSLFYIVCKALIMLEIWTLYKIVIGTFFSTFFSFLFIEQKCKCFFSPTWKWRFEKFMDKLRHILGFWLVPVWNTTRCLINKAPSWLQCQQWRKMLYAKRVLFQTMSTLSLEYIQWHRFFSLFAGSACVCVWVCVLSNGKLSDELSWAELREKRR